MVVAGRIAGAVWFRMIFFLPYVLADVVAGLIWRFMLDGDYGFPALITGALRACALLSAGETRTGRSPPC